jgi:DNA-binding transcriptional regulator YbjK
MTLIGPHVAVRLIGTLGREAVLAAIGLLAEAWPQARSGFRTANLRAVATIASTPYSAKRLLGALKGLDPDALYTEALALAGEASTQRLSSATEKLIRKAMGPA